MSITKVGRDPKVGETCEIVRRADGVFGLLGGDGGLLATCDSPAPLRRLAWDAGLWSLKHSYDLRILDDDLARGR